MRNATAKIGKKIMTHDGSLTMDPKNIQPIHELLNQIQCISWQAQAGLSGIIAVADKIVERLYGKSMEDEFTLQQISWLQIFVKEKVEEMIEIFDEAQDIENKLAHMELDARTTLLQKIEEPCKA